MIKLKNDNAEGELFNDNARQPLIPKDAQVFDSNQKNKGHGDYIVHINSPELHPDTETNRISTSKYTWYNFFPKILIEQFSKMANIYFLIIAIMQSIHEISISAGKPVILLPLCVVVFVNGLKDFLEDWKRKVSDDEENKRHCLILNKQTNSFEEKTWADVKLGNIVKVLENHAFPADMILINSSEQNGMSYIETKNLDGETNLKYRQANAKLAEDYKSERNLSQFEGVVISKAPNEFIYEFDAKLKVNENSEDFIYIDRNSFLLRGCYLKQTEYIYGLVTYIGHNTKIMKNSPNARSKVSKIENIMSFQIIVIFCVQIILSLTGAILSIIWYTEKFSEIKNYIFINQTNQKYIIQLISRMGTWILIFTNLVPISLLVTMEMIKYIQGMFISWDSEMYDQEKKFTAKVQTSTLNEELGQVKYLFSDKTGTLTKNYMEFRRMSIGTFIYGDERAAAKVDNNDDKGEITNVNFAEEEEKFSKHKYDELHENYEQIQLFLECIALCHTVITDAREEANNKIIYQASSPDEMCLVNAARYFGFMFKGRDINNNIFLEINGKQVDYQLLNILEYSSERKKMSVIVRSPDNKIRLFTKGADSVMREKVTQNPQMLDINEEHMQTFAKQGLRTLMLAYRDLDEEEYSAWNEEYLKAVSDPDNKEKLLPKIFNKMEKDLYLIGATAIEDQLQDNVGQTLEILIKAGIKIWMLTGDKMDTAKSIAFSCKLITHEFDVLEIPEKSRRYDISNHLKDKLKQIEMDPETKYALLIGTDEISKITSDSVLTEFFYELAIRCHAVVCCRVTPKQKALMVHLIKEKEEMNTTMAIGDGANDVNMITSAHIGVGIVGVEGTQAARASDYSIGQFSHIRKLLLVHGREFYRKNSFVVCYNFYKNVLFVMPQFWFGMVSFYSGQTLYDPWIYQLFNIVFASIPIIWFGIYDKEISYDELYSDPSYYTQGIVGKLFHSVRFWKWVFYGMLQGFFLFAFGYFAMKSAENDGRMQDLFSVGSLIYEGIVLIVNLKILFQTNTHCIVSITLFFLSVSSYWGVLFGMSQYYRFDNFNNFYMLHTSIWFYLTMLLILLSSFTVDIGIGRLLYYWGFIEDGKAIKPQKIDEHLQKTLPETNIKLEEKMRTKYYGEAFSQERGQIPYILKKFTN